MTPTTVRVAAATLTAALVTFSASGCGLDILLTTTTDEPTLDEAVTSVEFDLESSNVDVTAGAETKLTRKLRHTGDVPGPTHTLDNGTLTLGDCPQTGCDVDYTLVVGSDARVTGTSNSGDLSVSGIASAVTHTGSGTVHLADLASTAEARTGAGDVTLERIGGGASVRVDSGNVQVSGVGANLEVESHAGDITASSISGDVVATTSTGAVDVSLAIPANLRATAGAGDVTLTVPEGSYRVSAEAGSGDVTDDLSSDDSAEFAVEARTDSGNIHLRSA